MSQVQTTIISVNEFQTKSGKRAWKVIDSAGTEYTAWEPHEAQKAAALLQQPVTVEFFEKQNGQYVNRTFKDAAPVQNSPGQGITPPAPSEALRTAPVAVQGHSGAQGGDRDAQIIRQSSYKAAVELCVPLVAAGTPFPQVMEELRAVTDELVAYGLTGKWAGSTSVAAKSESAFLDSW